VAAANGQQPAPKAEAKQPEFVEEKGFKGRVFELKHRSPSTLIYTLGPLGSGFKGANMTYSNEFKTITVRDFPENLAAIEEAIKRLDTPEAPRPDIDLHVHVLIASNDSPVSGEYPAELGDVIKQLKTTLNYKNYGLMTSAVHRAKEGRQGVRNQGVAQSKLFEVHTPEGNPIFYEYRSDPLISDKTASGAAIVNTDGFTFNMRVPLNVGTAAQTSIQYQNVGFTTPVSLRDGEKVVVGTTAIGSKGLIVVLMMKVVK
jgi:hypothetical protein